MVNLAWRRREAVGGITGISAYSGHFAVFRTFAMGTTSAGLGPSPLSPSMPDWFPKLSGPNPHDRRDIAHEADGYRVRASGRYARRVYGGDRAPGARRGH